MHVWFIEKQHEDDFSRNNTEYVHLTQYYIQENSF